MTREEAIEIINRENDPNDKKVWELFPEYREALDMAIQALSQEPCDDVISRIKERIAYYENRKPKDGYDGVSYGKTEDGSGELKNPRKVEYERYSNRQIGLEEALEILQNHSVTQKSGKWIPVSESPKELGTYLIQTDGEPYMCQCRWTDVNPFWTDLKTKPHWNIFDLPQYSKVVAWMPLPKPYEPQESEDRTE